MVTKYALYVQLPASMGSGTLSPTGHHGERSNSGGLASAHGSNAVLDAGRQRPHVRRRRQRDYQHAGDARHDLK